MRHKRGRTWSSLAALGLLAVAGCGGPTPPPFNDSVDGTVTLDGSPLAGVRVIFTPKAIPGLTLTGSGALTDDKGHYTLIADNGKPGALACEHYVTVHQGRGAERSNEPDAPAPAARPKGGPSVPAKYAVAATSPLRVEIKPDQHTYDLKLAR
jgi:hypothetical protein